MDNLTLPLLRAIRQNDDNSVQTFLQDCSANENERKLDSRTLSGVLWVLACPKLGPTSREIFRTFGLMQDEKLMEKIIGIFPDRGVPIDRRIKYGKWLMNAGATPNVFCQGMPLLTYTIMYGNRTFAKMLIEEGADPNGFCPGSEQDISVENHPLMEAIIRGLKVIAEKLMEVGADINWRDPSGRTIFGYIADAFGYECIKGPDCFTEKMISVINHNAIDSTGRTPLFYAVKHHCKEKYNFTTEVVTTLILSGKVSNLDQTNNKGQTLLMMAVKNSCFAIASAVVEAGCNINAEDNEGRTALHMAAEQYEGRCFIEFLLNKGTDINFYNGKQPPPIYCAASKRYSDNVRCFIECNAAVPLCFESYGLPPLNMFDHGPRVMAQLILAGHKWDSPPQSYINPISYIRSQMPDFDSRRPIWINWEFSCNKNFSEVSKWRSEFVEENSLPLSLSHLCRLAIRRLVGFGLKHKRHYLGLSQILQDYIMLPEIDKVVGIY